MTLEEENAQLRAEIVTLKTQNADLMVRISALETRLALDSQNSS